MRKQQNILLMQVSLLLFPTWHDNVREAQFPGDGHAPSEEDHVLSPQLVDVAMEELQRHCQT